MDVNGQGALLRTSMLPVEPLDALVARALIELQSLQEATGLATTFLTRGEVLHRVRRFTKVRSSEAE
jgi:hypothetical protein